MQVSTMSWPQRSLLFFFFFQCYGDRRDLHSFPTRRSSDLTDLCGGRWATSVPTATVAKKPILLATQNDAGVSDPGPDDIHAVGTLGMVIQVLRLPDGTRSEEHTSELQSHSDLVCRLLLEKK